MDYKYSHIEFEHGTVDISLTEPDENNHFVMLSINDAVKLLLDLQDALGPYLTVAI